MYALRSGGRTMWCVSRFFTSDEHFSHANIIRLSARPFASLEEMNTALVERWNATVGPEDEVWCLGDFAMGRSKGRLDVVAALRGHKILIPGNHDTCAVYHKRAERERARYLEAGFDAVVAPQSLVLAEASVLVDHFPYVGDSGHDERYAAQRPADRGAWLLHGHVHDRWRQRGRMINVGVDAWGGFPVSEERLVSLITAGPARLDPLAW